MTLPKPRCVGCGVPMKRGRKSLYCSVRCKTTQKALKVVALDRPIFK